MKSWEDEKCGMSDDTHGTVLVSMNLISDIVLILR